VGLFSYSELTPSDLFFGDQCTDYEDWTEAGQHILFHAAQWCSIFAPVAGFLAWFQIFCESFICRLRGSYLLIIFLFIVASLLQGCTFLVFADTQFCFEAASENQCALKTGAWYSVGSILAYLLLAIISTANKPRDGNGSTCRGCCIITRGGDSAILDEENQKDENSDTSDDGLWHTDMDEEPDDGSAVNWTVAQGTGSNGSNKSNSGLIDSLFLNSDTSGAETDETNTIIDVDRDRSEILDSFAEEEELKVTKKAVARKTPPQDNDSARDRRTTDYFDAMCCGDPLEVEKHLKKNTRGSSKSNKKKRGKSESRTSHQESDDGVVLIPVV
jgi:hypothetical protein